jgi:hypothetical protein
MKDSFTSNANRTAANSRYDDYFKKKSLDSFNASGEGVADFSGPIGEGVAQRNWLGQEVMPEPQVEQTAGSSNSAGTGAMKAGQTLAQGGAPEDAVAQGLMMSGNPYAMGAGLALQTASGIKKGQNQRAQQRYLAEVERVQARQNAINKMAEIGQGLRA